jgi:Notch-like protein
MWKGTSCTDFTFCSQLSGTTQNDCLSKSGNCPYTNGSTCGGSNQLYGCSHFTAA